MEIATVGGGPGGLYASLLLKKANPEWDVTVYERNPSGVTYGWGIVFPNRGLENLKEADEQSHQDITDAFRQWEPFRVYYRGKWYTCGGNTFASMMRTDLLSVLQQRCEELGVDLCFETEIDDPAQLAAEADLVVAADGLHSRTRREFSDSFGTDLQEGSARFSWFGTQADFEALSHIFIKNEAGIWCAHTYPGRTSTFIVDCDVETWAESGLADMDEDEYLAYLQGVFDEHLEGHELLSQQDTWRQFTTVRNATWTYENVVLLGDAAHTAHYSVGSGTTLAMEGSIALAEALEKHGEDIPAALTTYERTHKPLVETLQRAGERSRRHFEEIRRFFGRDGPVFTAHHLTRSGRLTYESLRRRDPGFIETVNDWLAAKTRENVGNIPDDPGPEAAPGEPLNQAFQLRNMTLNNRLVRVIEPSLSARDGAPSDAHLAALAERNLDASLVLTDPVAVSASGRITMGTPGLYDDGHCDRWADAVDQIHERTAAIGAHLVHAGASAARDPRPFALSAPIPSESAWTPPLSWSFPQRPSSFRPTSMSRADMDRVRDAFVDAADRADVAGFDYLQIHAGHSYLLASFLSPLTNDREDQYGDDIDDRMRYPLEVVEAVRDTWPQNKPLGVTLQSSDWVAGGIGIKDAFVFADMLVGRGCDLVAPVAGGVDGSGEPDPMVDVSGCSDQIRNEAGVPTLATPYATTADKVNTLVGTGRADLCTFYGHR